MKSQLTIFYAKSDNGDVAKICAISDFWAFYAWHSLCADPDHTFKIISEQKFNNLKRFGTCSGQTTLLYDRKEVAFYNEYVSNNLK